jgi:hypothetical protein
MATFCREAIEKKLPWARHDPNMQTTNRTTRDQRSPLPPSPISVTPSLYPFLRGKSTAQKPAFAMERAHTAPRVQQLTAAAQLIFYEYCVRSEELRLCVFHSPAKRRLGGTGRYIHSPILLVRDTS